MKRIYNEYRKRLSENNYFDTIHIYDTLSEQFSHALLQDYTHIIIAGLVAATAAENKIIKDIIDNLPAELILHTSHADVTKMSTTDSPFYPHYKLLRALSTEKTTLIGAPDKTEPAVIHIKRTETEAQQSLYLGSMLKKITEHYKPHRIAIVLTDETIVYSITETLRAHGIDFNLSTGFPLSHSLLYSFLNQLHLLIENGLHYRAFFAFIKHPLFKNAIIDEQPLRPLIYRLQREMVKAQLNYFEPDTYQDTEFAPLIALVKKCIDTVQHDVALHEYITNIVVLLNEVLSYNKEFLKTNKPDIREFFDHLDDLAKLRIPRDHIKHGSAVLEFILHILKNETYHVQGDPMKGIQVIGFLEARNLDFDCMIIPSMNEGIFPRRNEKDLFVNQPVRKEIGLPYDKERDNLFYYYFTEMISGKKEVFMTYVEEEKRDIRSRFIDFLAEQEAIIDTTKIPFHSIAITIPTREVKKDKDLMRALLYKMTRRGLSPTHLKDYRQCPYRFYLKHLLGIQEPEEIKEEADPALWGIIIHKTLKEFYKYDFPHGITTSDLTSAREHVYKRLESAVKSELAQTPKRVTYLDLELYKRRLNQFLLNEIEHFQEGYTIDKTHLEKSLRLEIAIGPHQVRLFGYTDRVDMIDHHYFVIDYKSSLPPRKTYQLGDDFVEFQLPVYSMMLVKDNLEAIDGMAYYIISQDSKLVGIVKKEHVAHYLNEFQNQILLPTMSEMLDPTTSFYHTENQDACRYCPYTQLCGVKRV
jgi:RecB family exonuclease